MRARSFAAKPGGFRALGACDPLIRAGACEGDGALASARRGPSGSATPKAVLTALTSAKRLPRFAMTLANAMSVRSSIVRPVVPARP